MPEVRPETAPFTPEQAALLLAVGQAAPSIHNTQPWRFDVRADSVEVWTDPRRALPAVDPDGRQRLISCGAAILNLRLAIARLGFEASTSLCPDRREPDHVATVTRGPARTASRDERALYEMIRWRRTNRSAYRPQPVPPPVLRRLHTAAERESAVLREIDSPQERAAVAALIRRGIEEEARSPAVRQEFLRWLSDDAEPTAGTPLRSWLDSPYPLPAVTGREQLTPGERAGLDQLAAESTLALLCTDGDDPADRLRAGQALQRLLLTATAAGVAVSFLNQPIEVPTLRTELSAIPGVDAVPQMLLRAGYSRQAALRTGRRPTR